MTDIKRVLAYSTISQLGYMMLALGVGGYTVGDLPPVHARVLQGAALPGLRLGEPRDEHVRHAQDGRSAQVHADHDWTFLIGTLSLSGFFPLAGFWSKDEILSVAYDERPWLFVVALVTAGLTAFYMFRAIFMTFGGEYKGGEPAEDARRLTR